ncbi:MAG: SelL-related redox protein [Pirellulales bacterium]
MKSSETELGQAAPTLELLQSTGDTVPLKQLWKNGPLLLQFSRHLGCAFCRESASLLKRDYAEIQKHGGEVALITMGDQDQAAAFSSAFDLPFPVFADPQQQLYTAFDVPRGSMNQVLGPQVWLKGLLAMARCGLSKPQGDLMQLQATYLIDTAGKVRWQYLPKNSADHPELNEILAAIEQLK